MVRRLNNSKHRMILILLLFSLMTCSCSKEKNEKLKDFDDGIIICVGES